MTERGISGVVVAAALAGLLVGCGGGRTHGVAGARVTFARECTAGLQRPVGSARVSWAAVVVRTAFAYHTPARARIARFGLLNVNGVSTVFGVLGEQVDARCRPQWLHVLLPLRPN